MPTLKIVSQYFFIFLPISRTKNQPSFFANDNYEIFSDRSNVIFIILLKKKTEFSFLKGTLHLMKDIGDGHISIGKDSILF
jgi:hypothetical protein